MVTNLYIVDIKTILRYKNSIRNLQMSDITKKIFSSKNNFGDGRTNTTNFCPITANTYSLYCYFTFIRLIYS